MLSNPIGQHSVLTITHKPLRPQKDKTIFLVLVYTPVVIEIKQPIMVRDKGIRLLIMQKSHKANKKGIKTLLNINITVLTDEPS